MTGPPHAGKTVTVEVADTCFRILDQHETMLGVVPRINTEEVTPLQGLRPLGRQSLESVKDHLKPMHEVDRRQGHQQPQRHTSLDDEDQAPQQRESSEQSADPRSRGEHELMLDRKSVV